MFYVSSPMKKYKFRIGDHVKISGGGQLVGMVVDYMNNDFYVIAFQGGAEFAISSHLLHRAKKDH